MNQQAGRLDFYRVLCNFILFVYSSFFVKISRLVCFITKVSFSFDIYNNIVCVAYIAGWGEPPIATHSITLFSSTSTR